MGYTPGTYILLYMTTYAMKMHIHRRFEVSFPVIGNVLLKIQGAVNKNSLKIF